MRTTRQPFEGAAEKDPAHAPIIDVHLHAYPLDAVLGPDLANPATGSPGTVADGAAHLEACLAQMRRYNIVKGVVSAGSGDRLAVATAWRDTAPDLFVAGAGIRGSEEIPLPPIDELRRRFMTGELEVLGEITAQYAGLTLSDEPFEPYLALAEELDVPVAVHTGIGPPGVSYDPSTRGFRARLGNPLCLEEALNRHSRLRLSLMHAGWPYLDDTIALMVVYPQVYADLGAVNWYLPRAAFHAYLEGLMQAGLGERVMFGSDQMYWPEAIGMAVEATQSAPFLSGSERRDVFYDNAARFFRLPDEYLSS
jgi:uncharacterized protein